MLMSIYCTHNSTMLSKRSTITVRSLHLCVHTSNNPFRSQVAALARGAHLNYASEKTGHICPDPYSSNKNAAKSQPLHAANRFD